MDIQLKPFAKNGSHGSEDHTMGCWVVQFVLFPFSIVQSVPMIRGLSHSFHQCTVRTDLEHSVIVVPQAHLSEH